MKRLWKTVSAACGVAGVVALGLSQVACLEEGASRPAPPSKFKPRVVTTTTMVTDMVRQIGGDRVDVVALMRTGIDPHSYKLKARDSIHLQSADVIIYSGLGLEGKITQTFDDLKGKGKVVHAVTEKLSSKQLRLAEGGHPDPHVWGDPTIWAECVSVVTDALKEAAPDHAAEYEKNARAYAFELKELHQWITVRLDEALRIQDRVLVTTHDAFSYFGAEYDFEVLALQGISTEDEAGLADVMALVETIKQKKVRAIFLETSTSPILMNQVSADALVKIGGHLYSDSLGEDETVVRGAFSDLNPSTYIDMMKVNVLTIVQVLQPAAIELRINRDRGSVIPGVPDPVKILDSSKTAPAETPPAAPEEPEVLKAEPVEEAP